MARGRARARRRTWERVQGLNRNQGRRSRQNPAEQIGVSIYVNNLPHNLDKYGLQGIFSTIGRVVDSYIPKGNRLDSRPKYGFVRFASTQEANRSIQLLNRKIIRGHQIAISFANSVRPSRKKDRQQKPNSKPLEESAKHQNRREWRRVRKSEEDSRQQTSLAQQYKEPPPLTKSVIGSINADFMPWLSTSLVCSSLVPRDVAILANAINCGYGQCNHIYALSGYKFILTFQNEEALEVALQHPEELQHWFSDIKRWDKYERCSTRKVWLEIIGVPPHGWLWENFKTIAELWGCLICLGKPILRTDSFVSMKLLIETDVLSYIDEAIVLMIDDMGFRIHVKEAQTPSMVIQEHKSPHIPLNETVDSNGSVPGFEDLDKSPGQMNTPVILLGENSHDPAKIQCCDGNHLGSKMVREESHQGTGEASAGTGSQTKTAQFSRNVDSNEVINKAYEFKNLNRLTAEAGAKELNDDAVEESPREPPGFEKQKNIQSLGHGSQVFALPERGTNEYKQSELMNTVNTVTTTDQANGNPQTSTPSDRYETIAQEALNIGEMLGLRVISNRETAVLNLAESMRVQNKKRTSTKQPVRAEISLN